MRFIAFLKIYVTIRNLIHYDNASKKLIKIIIWLESVENSLSSAFHRIRIDEKLRKLYAING